APRLRPSRPGRWPSRWRCGAGPGVRVTEPWRCTHSPTSRCTNATRTASYLDCRRRAPPAPMPPLPPLEVYEPHAYGVLSGLPAVCPPRERRQPTADEVRTLDEPF